MPFRLKGALATFQGRIDCIIQGKETITSAYLDDLILCSGPSQEHLQHIGEVMRCLQEAGLTANPRKVRLQCPSDHTWDTLWTVEYSVLRFPSWRHEVNRCKVLYRQRSKYEPFWASQGSIVYLFQTFLI